MKKRVYSVIFLGLLILGSCSTTNTAGLETLDKPIRLGQFFAIVSKYDPDIVVTSRPVVGGVEEKRNYGPIYITVLSQLLNDIDKISDAIKLHTGFPLDIDRFFKEYRQGEVTIDPMGITWSAVAATQLANSNEAFVQINPVRRKIWVLKSGGKENGIYMVFTY